METGREQQLLDLAHEFIEIEKEQTSTLKFIADKLTEDPIQMEVEHGPPICPHCGVFNPGVKVHESGGHGPLSEYVVLAQCEDCGDAFYIVIESYSMHRDRDSAMSELKTRQENMGVVGNGRTNHS